ncbi:hypothetical protein MUY27_08855 [Mucilaginibacter sp. RS28]|uniref:Uncharacterized protein n=1 Tax=Mucilaginibacter straminoryzae TaxID=2932774 RepID=A0A9X1X2T1_9SPHI|nr:hypothetical protein [Mucilaginibacter straminoryzae]MCJ8209816.1 hypothetical protein [Mucilaginibacter straminoryzae]
MGEALDRYKTLLNEILPGTFVKPVRYNHCFNRIVLDWLFQDVWYKHLERAKPAVTQVSEAQLSKMVYRMEQWLAQPHLLWEDNRKSLAWRRDYRQKG